MPEQTVHDMLGLMETTATGSISMKDILAHSDYNLPKVGQVVHGEIISNGKNAVLIDLGSIGIGIVYPGEFYDNTQAQKSLLKGQKVSTVLLDIENEEGYRELSLKRAQITTAWEDIRQKKESGEIMTTKVTNINKGGLIVEINGVQGFLPLSQLATEHYPKVEGGSTTMIVQALQKFRNQEIKMKIIDFSETENRLIVSEKAIYDDQLKEVLATLHVGDTVNGTISDVTDFGAFVLIDIARPEGAHTGKVEGLIHISEIDWKIIDNPRDVLKVGDIITAKITAIEGNKVSLSLKALKTDPWVGIEKNYAVGQTTKGIIVKLTNYGALIALAGDIIGLIPAAEFEPQKPKDVLNAGEEINISITSIESTEHKMVLALVK